MEIRRCMDCNEYKYIEKDGKCPTCLNKWIVIYRLPYKSGKDDVVESDLSKSKALELASESVYYMAKPESEL